MQQPPEVTVVGSANADLVVRVERRPDPGETVLGGDLAVLPGGKGANQAVAAGRLGARTAFIGCVGDDDHGRLLLASLTGAGVDVSGVRRVAAPTGVAMIVLDGAGENSIIVSPGANAALTPDDARVEAVARGAVVVLQREVDPGVSLAAAHHATGLVVLNLAPSGPVPAGLLERTGVLVVNEFEAADLLVSGPVHDPETAARRLLTAGPDAVVITLGGGGAVAVDGSGTHRVTAPRVEVVDTTGAGDAFTGALAWRLALGDDLASAVRQAVLAGAVAVTRAGAQPSFATPADVEAADPS